MKGKRIYTVSITITVFLGLFLAIVSQLNSENFAGTKAIENSEFQLDLDYDEQEQIVFENYKQGYLYNAVQVNLFNTIVNSLQLNYNEENRRLSCVRKIVVPPPKIV